MKQKYFVLAYDLGRDKTSIEEIEAKSGYLAIIQAKKDFHWFYPFYQEAGERQKKDLNSSGWISRFGQRCDPKLIASFLKKLG